MEFDDVGFPEFVGLENNRYVFMLDEIRWQFHRSSFKVLYPSHFVSYKLVINF